MPGISSTGIPFALPEDIVTDYPTIVDQPRAELLRPIWLGTQAEYDAIATKDPETLYVIVG